MASDKDKVGTAKIIPVTWYF